MLAAAFLLSVLGAEAQAGTLQISRKGLLPTHVWVDGQAKGKLKRKAPLVLNLADGQHEVWLALEEEGVVTLCS